MGSKSKAKSKAGMKKPAKASSLGAYKQTQSKGVKKGSKAKTSVVSKVRSAYAKASATKAGRLVGVATSAIPFVGSAKEAVSILAEKKAVAAVRATGRRRRRRKYMTIRVPRNRRGIGRITKSEERYLRNTANRMAYTEGGGYSYPRRRRSRRRRGGNRQYMAWVRSFRRY